MNISNLYSIYWLEALGGILTVADDLLKNDGQKFLEMMESLAERRLQREEEAAAGFDDSEEEDEQDEDEEDDDDLEDEDEEDVSSEILYVLTDLTFDSVWKMVVGCSKSSQLECLNSVFSKLTVKR